jgi:hypothetical protein
VLIPERVLRLAFEAYAAACRSLLPPFHDANDPMSRSNRASSPGPNNPFSAPIRDATFFHFSPSKNSSPNAWTAEPLAMGEVHATVVPVCW